jgi:hypothetical protein
MVWLGIGEYHASNGAASMKIKRRQYARKKKEIRRAFNTLFKTIDKIKHEYELSDDARNFPAMKRDLVVIGMNSQNLLDGVESLLADTSLKHY